MSVLEYRAAEASTRLAAQKAYINAIKSVKATAVAREELRLAEVALEIARRRREAGIAADSEVEQAAMKVLDCQIAPGEGGERREMDEVRPCRDNWRRHVECHLRGPSGVRYGGARA